MNKTEQKQAAKGKAFNALKSIFHPKSNWRAPEFPRDESFSEKRDYVVECIMEEYFKEIDTINKKYYEN